MKKPLHIIYITGLGDAQPDGQRKVIKTWHRWGVEPELFQMNWGDKEPWSPKFSRMLDRIDELVGAGKQVGLVGASAGASAAINAFAARKDVLVGVVCLAGKVNRPAAIDQRHSIVHPAFVMSVRDCQQALASLGAADRTRILSRYGFFDELVSEQDSYIPGAHNSRAPTGTHFLNIAAQITIGAPSFIRFLKKQTP